MRRRTHGDDVFYLMKKHESPRQKRLQKRLNLQKNVQSDPRYLMTLLEAPRGPPGAGEWHEHTDFEPPEPPPRGPQNRAKIQKKANKTLHEATCCRYIQRSRGRRAPDTQKARKNASRTPKSPQKGSKIGPRSKQRRARKTLSF